MRALLRFLRKLLVAVPLEVVAAVMRLLALLFVAPLAVLIKLLEWLLELLRTKNLYPTDEDDHCPSLPEAILRRPDPCIYSQRLLQSQGLPVTWNNPDIWVARADDPGTIEPDSYHLVEATDYIVSVRVHNASTDLALGVRVRLDYRPWSFNSPDLVPVETDATGNEAFRFVDVMPMGSTVTQFRWRTPPLAPSQAVAHFCLQASLFHPLDINSDNNMGQENTNVYRENLGDVAPGERVAVDVPLFNYARTAQRFRFEAALYAINPDDTVELRLAETHGYARWSWSQRVANATPILRPSRRMVGHGGLGRFDLQSRPRLQLVKTRYVGFEPLRETLLNRDYSLPAGMTITANGQDLGAGVRIEAKEERAVQFMVAVPNDAPPGAVWPVTLLARADNGVLAGGVTIIFNVREGD